MAEIQQRATGNVDWRSIEIPVGGHRVVDIEAEGISTGLGFPV